MNKKIVITGATGFLGRKLSEKLISQKHKVGVISRSSIRAKSLIQNAHDYFDWDYISTPYFINGYDVIIHLAGENIMAKRWTEKHKMNVIESRTLSTRALIKGIENSDVKPSTFICASGVGFYGNSEEPVDETSAKGTGFLSDVVSLWENEAAQAEKLGLRKVSLRTGLVLDKNDGALKRILPPFLFFIGGPLGSGNQWFPWIHIDDFLEVILFAIENPNVKGAINLVSPNLVRMKVFAAALGKVLRRPSIFRVPEFFLRILLGESADALIGGARVLPRKLIELGYKFRFENIDDALKDIFKRNS